MYCWGPKANLLTSNYSMYFILSSQLPTKEDLLAEVGQYIMPWTVSPILFAVCASNNLIIHGIISMPSSSIEQQDAYNHLTRAPAAWMIPNLCNFAMLAYMQAALRWYQNHHEHVGTCSGWLDHLLTSMKVLDTHLSYLHSLNHDIHICMPTYLPICTYVPCG